MEIEEFIHKLRAEISLRREDVVRKQSVPNQEYGDYLTNAAALATLQNINNLIDDLLERISDD